MTPTKPRFLDTNILFAFLTRDDEQKAQHALALLLRVEAGEERMETSLLVVVEVVFTLGRRHRMAKDRIREVVGPIVEMEHLHLENKQLFARALDLFVERNVPFADAFNVATMEARGITTIYSWDRDLDRFPDITRLEPDEGRNGE